MELSKKPVGAGLEGDKSAEEVTPFGDSRKCCVCGTKKRGKKCSQCKMVLYCSVKCQKEHFRYHNKYCKAIAELQKLESEKMYRNFSVREDSVDRKLQSRLVRL